MFITVTIPSKIYGRNPQYPNPPFLMTFIYAKNRGHKYMYSITFYRGEYFFRERECTVFVTGLRKLSKTKP